MEKEKVTQKHHERLSNSGGNKFLWSSYTSLYTASINEIEDAREGGQGKVYNFEIFFLNSVY